MIHRIKMLRTQHAGDDGAIRPTAFIEGREYEVGDRLPRSFIELGVIESPDKPGGKSPGRASDK